MTASSLSSRLNATLYFEGYGYAELLVQRSRRSLRSWLPWFVKVRIGIDLCEALSVAIGRIRMLCRDLDEAESTLRSAGWTRTPGASAWRPPLGPSAEPVIDAVDKASAALSTVQTSIAALKAAAMARSQAPASPAPQSELDGDGGPADAVGVSRIVLEIEGNRVDVYVDRAGSAGQPS